MNEKLLCLGVNGIVSIPSRSFGEKRNAEIRILIPEKKIFMTLMSFQRNEKIQVKTIRIEKEAYQRQRREHQQVKQANSQVHQNQL